MFTSAGELFTCKERDGKRLPLLSFENTQKTKHKNITRLVSSFLKPQFKFIHFKSFSLPYIYLCLGFIASSFYLFLLLDHILYSLIVGSCVQVIMLLTFVSKQGLVVWPLPPLAGSPFTISTPYCDS